MDNRFKYLLNPMAGVILPGLQAGITSLVAGSLAGSVAWVRGSSNPVGIGFISAAAVFLIVWFIRLDSWIGLVRNDKMPAYQPINNRADTVRVELIQQEGAWGDWLDLPIDRDRLIEMGRDIESGKGFSLAEFGGRGKLLSRAEYEALRDRMIVLGLARWKNRHSHNTGVELTGPGRAIMKKYSSLSPTDTGIL